MYPVAPIMIYTPCPVDQAGGHCVGVLFASNVEVMPATPPAENGSSATVVEKPQPQIQRADEIMSESFDDNLFVKLASFVSCSSAQSLVPLIAYRQNPPPQAPPDPQSRVVTGKWRFAIC